MERNRWPTIDCRRSISSTDSTASAGCASVVQHRKHPAFSSTADRWTNYIPLQHSIYLVVEQTTQAGSDWIMVHRGASACRSKGYFVLNAKICIAGVSEKCKFPNVIGMRSGSLGSTFVSHTEYWVWMSSLLCVCTFHAFPCVGMGLQLGRL